MLHNATEVQVLVELTEQDAAQAREMVHQRRLKTLSMLQVRKDSLQPLDLLQSLLSSLDGLTHEQNASESALKQAFETEFHPCLSLGP